VRWTELIDDQRVFLVRAGRDIWSEVERGTLAALEAFRSRRGERLPVFRQGDVLLLVLFPLPEAGAPPPSLSHVVKIRSGWSNEAGYAVGSVYRVEPPLTRDRMLFAAQRGGLPEVFGRFEEPLFSLAALTDDQRDQFRDYAVDAGILLQSASETPGALPAVPEGDPPGIVEFDW